MIFIYVNNITLLLWGIKTVYNIFAYQIWYKLNIQISDHSITSSSCCQQTDMRGVKLQMDMSLIRINGPWGVENTPLVTEIWRLKCKQVL